MRNENIAGIDEFFIILKNMWLERSSLYMDQNFDQAQSKKKSFTKQTDNVQSSQPASNILQPTVSQPAFPSYDEMQKSFQAMFDKQDAKHKAEMEKLKAEFESKMSQQPKKSRPPVPPKDYEQLLGFYEGAGDPRWSNPSREERLEWMDKAFPPPIATKPERLRSTNQSTRINRMEEGLNETREAMNQLTEEFQKLNIRKGNIAKSNFNRSYFTPLKPINLYSNLANEEDKEGGYDEEENIWYDSSEKKNNY